MRLEKDKIWKFSLTTASICTTKWLTIQLERYAQLNQGKVQDKPGINLTDFSSLFITVFVPFPSNLIKTDSDTA